MLSAKLPFESAVLQFNGTIFFLQILPCFSTNTFEEFSIKIKIEKMPIQLFILAKKRQTLKTQQEKLREENS